uniref:Syndecan n=1 Tax=Phallusia mammillata TaxID=59560 RepID=A0A6F9DS14_9ASCI|nr:syndecan-2 [Phallusia mammillata]
MMRRSFLLLGFLLLIGSSQVKSTENWEYEVEGSASLPGDDEDMMMAGSGSGSSITFDGKYDDEMILFTNPSNSSSTTYTSVPTTEITILKGDSETEDNSRNKAVPIPENEPEINEGTTTVATTTEAEIDDEEEEIIVEDDLDVKEPTAINVGSIFQSTHFMTALIVGGCVGLLFAICVIMLLAYRMRKKDEGSYALDEQKKPASPSAYQYTQGQEYYA